MPLSHRIGGDPFIKYVYAALLAGGVRLLLHAISGRRQ